MSSLFIIQIVAFVIFLSSGFAIALIALGDLLSKIVIRKDYAQQRSTSKAGTRVTIAQSNPSATPVLEKAN